MNPSKLDTSYFKIKKAATGTFLPLKNTMTRFLKDPAPGS